MFIREGKNGWRRNDWTFEKEGCTVRDEMETYVKIEEPIATSGRSTERRLGTERVPGAGRIYVTKCNDPVTNT
jgi:hypothetical protein